MKVAIFGLGYVGFTAMCCIASEGHQVVGFDVSTQKVAKINEGVAPFSEPGIQELLTDVKTAGRVSAFTDIGQKLDDADMAIVCVGTPSAPDGSHNMSYIAEVSRQIAQSVSLDRETPLTVVFRSTVRPGTITGLIEPIFRSELGDEGFEKAVALVYNPEFLREATAIQDYFEPPKIIIGTRDGKPNASMDELNANISAPVFYVGYGESEITKFVDNTWHAVKVAYANEIGRICMQLGISAAKAHEIFISDTKLNISPYYTRPGGAFGGSCLPKDVRAFQYISGDCGAGTHLIDSLLRSNESHKFSLYQMAIKDLPRRARLLLVGLAFKANTDDLRESPNIDLARNLLKDGYELSIFDPAVDATKLVGANLGYAYTQLPAIQSLLIGKDEAEGTRFDRVIVANATVKHLTLADWQDVVDLNKLS
jgi:GDP-mannose 6-dehydrogenase